MLSHDGANQRDPAPYAKTEERTSADEAFRLHESVPQRYSGSDVKNCLQSAGVALKLAAHLCQLLGASDARGEIKQDCRLLTTLACCGYQERARRCVRELVARSRTDDSDLVVDGIPLAHPSGRPR